MIPLLTLSREAPVLGRARARFVVCQLGEEQWYPRAEDLLAHRGEVEALAATGSIWLEKRGSRWCWATRVFVAYRP